MCNACGFVCCAWDGFSKCGCEHCDEPDCWPVCEHCKDYLSECSCDPDDDEIYGPEPLPQPPSAEGQ